MELKCFQMVVIAVTSADAGPRPSSAQCAHFPSAISCRGSPPTLQAQCYTILNFNLLVGRIENGLACLFSRALQLSADLSSDWSPRM